MIANACKGLFAVVAALLTLTSGSAVAAVATTDGASSPTERIIQMEGRVNPGGAAVTNCFFEYGTDATYGAVAPCTPKAADLGAGTADVAVTGDTQALEPGVTYHYRVVASDGSATSRGEDHAFALPGTPLCQGANLERRLEQGIGTILLPSCMALEMVSPPKKFNQQASEPSRVSPDGTRVVFNARAALEGAPCLLNALGGVYVASRGSSSWDTRDTCPDNPDLANTQVGSFSPDLSRWVLTNVTTEAQAASGVGQAFTETLGSPASPISPLMRPLNDVVPSPGFVEAGRLQGASADHSHTYLQPGILTGFADQTAKYLPGDPEPTGFGADFNVYVAYRDEARQPSLELLARDRHGEIWGGNCGSRIGGLGGQLGGRNQGAISADGSKVLFSTRPGQPSAGSCDPFSHGLRIMARMETASGPEISELFTSPAGPGDDLFQGASVDGTKVYFTSNRQLAATDLDSGAPCSPALVVSTSCDLYLYDATQPVDERLIQVSTAPSGSGANVLDGVTAISGDGSRAYFVAKGVLTGANDEGKSPVAGQPNLYVWNAADKATTYIATLDQLDNLMPLWGGVEGTFKNAAYPVPATGTDSEGNQVGGSGQVLLFESKAALTPDDLDGNRADVFRYDSVEGTLDRVSKAAPGGNDNGPFDAGSGRAGAAAPGTDLTETHRWVSEDGETIVFSSLEELVPGGAAGVRNTYLWRNGQLFRIPGLRRPGSTAQQVLSHDGSTVAFATASRLLPEDGDTITDVYVAREGGGFPPPTPPVQCQPDGSEGCQGSPGAGPADEGLASQALRGSEPGAGCRYLTRRIKRLNGKISQLRRRAARASGTPRAMHLQRQARRLDRRKPSLRAAIKRCQQEAAGVRR